MRLVKGKPTSISVFSSTSSLYRVQPLRYARHLMSCADAPRSVAARSTGVGRLSADQPRTRVMKSSKALECRTYLVWFLVRVRRRVQMMRAVVTGTATD